MLHVVVVVVVLHLGVVLLAVLLPLVHLVYLMQLLFFCSGAHGTARHVLSRTFWGNKGIESCQQELSLGWRLQLLLLRRVLVH